MESKVCIVTGADTGIGFETALGLAEAGAHVVMVCRSLERGERPRQKIIKKTGNPNLDLLTCDLAEQTQVRHLPQQLLERYDRIDVLLNNAGIWKSKREITSDGIETTFAVNHLAYFLLSDLLKDRLTESAPSRIINGPSDTHSLRGHPMLLP
jgi:retinol dehydrogenase-12